MRRAFLFWLVATVGGTVLVGSSQAQPLQCGGKAVTIAGTEGNDKLTGTAGPDVIHGRGGDDVIEGLAGNDLLCGGAGDDVIRAGDGLDRVWGGTGADELHGGRGPDFMYGEAGEDVLYGEADDDELDGGEGDDRLLGSCDPALPQRQLLLLCSPEGTDRDTLLGGPGDDTLTGAVDNDILSGGPGKDVMNAGPGDDEIDCGTGEGDRADGGPGRDLFTSDSGKCASAANIENTPAYLISQVTLTLSGRYTDKDDRTFFVAGCVPRTGAPPAPGFSSSPRTVCAGLDPARGKVVETEFHSCESLLANGVVHGLFVLAGGEGRWKALGFTCREMKDNGTLGSDERRVRLVDLSSGGEQASTLIPADRLPIGILEVYDAARKARGTLRQLGFLTAPAAAVDRAGAEGTPVEDRRETRRIPNAPPAQAGTAAWTCPPGMVLTGLGFGHVPQPDKKSTRPVYLLGECRTLVRH